MSEQKQKTIRERDWPFCPNCDEPLEFEYSSQTWVCERCGFEHEEEDL